MHILIETMCTDLDPSPYIKGQGHTGQFKVRVHMLVPAFQLTCVLMEYHATWHKCFPS